MSTLPDPVLALVAAACARDVGSAIGSAAGAGWCETARAWRHDPARDLLIAIGDTAGAADPAARRAFDTLTPQWSPDRTSVAVALMGPDGPCGVASFSFAAPADAIGASLDRLTTCAGAALARALADDRHRRDAAMLAAAMPLVEDGIMVVTLDGQVLHYNAALQALVGWTREDVVERGWTNCVYATDAERLAAQTAIASLVLGRPSEGTRRTLVRKDGSTFTAGIWSRVVVDPSGGAPALLGVVRDVTARDRAQATALREENLSQLGRLARAVAHDMNNLFCAVGGHAQLIEMWSSDERVRRSAALLIDATQQGARLTRQLLAFGGPSNAVLEPLGALGLARRTVELYRAAAADGLALVLTGDDTVVVEADVGQIHQALLNTLTNAGRACGGQGRIDVSVDRCTLPDGLTWRAAGAPLAGTEVARIRVSDSGPGFPNVPLERLFEPFFTTHADGHGVGLAAVQGVIASHGGAIRLSSNPGACVELFLPLSTRPELVYDDLVRARGGNEGRVWIFDEHVQVLEFSRIALAAQGFEVRVFASAVALREAARTTAADARPSVLVLDLSTDGAAAEALPELRAAGIDAPVLWVSGGNVRASAPGGYLPKPYTGTALGDAVAALLRRSPMAP